MIATAALLLLGAVTVTPPRVPAHGHQEAIVTSDAPGMVHLETAGTKGTRCEVVDHLRGPFATAGAAGHEACALDLLLDAGTYKVRLASPDKGKGELTLKATPFTELNASFPALDAGQAADLPLHPGQQASWWIHLETKQFLLMRVAGRTAGQVELWRDGHWREEGGASDDAPSPVAGQRIHEWWIARTFEAGNYLLTVYGVQAEKWTKGPETDALVVQRGFPGGSEGHSEDIVIPGSGLFGLTLQDGRTTALISMTAGIETPTTLHLHPIATDGSVNLQGGARMCTIQPRAQVPQCAVGQYDAQPHLAIVRGAPGTVVRLQWFTNLSSKAGDGSTVGTDVAFAVPETRRYLVGTADLTPDSDAPPLSCVLKRYPGTKAVQIGDDLLEVSVSKHFQRSFNFTPRSTTVWFKVTEGSRYDIETSGDRINSCDLYELSEMGADVRLTQTKPNAPRGCHEHLSLGPGQYRLDLYGLAPGVEKLRIAAVGASTEDTAPKSGCLIPDVVLDKTLAYELFLNRSGQTTDRILLVRDQPLDLVNPLPINMDGRPYVRIPVAAGNPISVYAGSGDVTCSVAQGHDFERPAPICHPAASESGGILAIKPAGTESPFVMVARSRPPTPPSALRPYKPKLFEPPVLAADEPMFFDFDREESHSALFDVKEAGLYDVTTEGLLATQCRMRTAVVTDLGSNTSGGRGRNCLLEQYLRPGRYLVTAQTVEQSKGRAAIVLHRRQARTAPPVTADGDAFFRADPGELIEQKLSVSKTTKYALSTTDRGIANQCRLEDGSGWPLVAVPMACTTQMELRKGHYVWTQLPLTVESMRHTRLAAEKPPVIFRGHKVHAVLLNEWSDALLRKDGKDEYFINLQADADVTFVLTNRMQGRLYAIGADQSLKPVDIIPPSDVQSAPATTGDLSGEEEVDTSNAHDEGEGAAPEPDQSGESEGDSGEGEAEGGEQPEQEEAPPPPVRRARHHRAFATPTAPTALPSGHTVRLTAGPYKLIAVHSQGDVAIQYRIFVGTDVLIPGESRTVNAPTTLTIRVPRDGTVRLATSGETDVRCRVFDGARLVTENDHNGEDWNCALAEPFAKGDYRLVIESETLAAGETKVSLGMADVQDVGVLASGATLKVGSSVLVGAVPPATGDVIQEVTFKSGDPISCAMEDPSGKVLDRKLSVTDCDFLLRPAAGAYHVRLWTLDRPATAAVTLAALPIATHDDGRGADGQAIRATIPASGRYTTDENAQCIAEHNTGLLVPCGGSVSLEKGAWFFARPHAKALGTALHEELLISNDPITEQIHLAGWGSIQRHQSSGRSIHLLRVTAAEGEHDAPACGIDEGARALLPRSCIASSRAGTIAVERWWAPDAPLDAELFRAVAVLPYEVTALAPGERPLTLTGETTRFSLSSDHGFRLNLTLPARTWAMLLAPDGAVSNLCASTDAPARCVLSGRGGELILHGEKGSQAEAILLISDVPAQSKPLLSVAEELLPGPGTLAYDVATDTATRVLRVEGAAHCLTTLSDGTRTGGCEAPIPPQRTAHIEIDADGGAIRASVGAPDKHDEARFGPVPKGNPSWLPWSQAVELGTNVTDRSFTLDREGIVHIHADSGVCALVSGTTFLQTSGLGGSCAIDRLLGAGTYRLLVRPFGRLALTGTVSWTTEPVVALADGVGPESSLAAGQSRLYRFVTASGGKVGIGIQSAGDTLDCAVMDEMQRVIGTGCQQYLTLEAGPHILAIHAPATLAPVTYRPVILGLAGAQMAVPQDYLRDFFRRIGEGQ